MVRPQQILSGRSPHTQFNLCGHSVVRRSAGEGWVATSAISPKWSKTACRPKVEVLLWRACDQFRESGEK